MIRKRSVSAPIKKEEMPIL